LQLSNIFSIPALVEPESLRNTIESYKTVTKLVLQTVSVLNINNEEHDLHELEPDSYPLPDQHQCIDWDGKFIKAV